MEIEIYLNKSLEETASLYYEKAKKAKKKIKGAEEALKKLRQQLQQLEQEIILEQKAEPKKISQEKKEWYEKFRWFISSEGFLVIGGRDATSNEIVIKKHTNKGDIVFHTDIAGSPFFVVKTDGKQPSEVTMRETADATVTFSRVWKLGMQTTPVFWVKPEQISKEAKAGEYLQKGAFMIYGKTNYIDNRINCAVGIYDGKVVAGPVSAIKKHCQNHVEILQGNEKPSSIAKLINKKLGGSVDDIIRALPSGGCKIKVLK